MEALEIIGIVLSCLVLALGGVIVAMLAKQKKGGQPTEDSKAIQNAQIQNTAEIKAAVESLGSSIDAKIDAKIAMQMVQLQQAMQSQTNSDVQRLNSFQTTISTYLSQQIKNLKDEVAQSLNQISVSTTNQINAMRKTMTDMADSDTKRINDFQTSVNGVLVQQNQQLNQKLDESLKTINEKVNQSLTDGFKGTSESMASLQHELGIVQAAQKDIGSLQSQITSLAGILSNNQARGRYGEVQLEMLLENVFGPKGELYDTQYHLQDKIGDEPELKPDAVVFLDGDAHKQIICIDSKFSITGYEDLFDPAKHLTETESAKAKADFRTALKGRIDETSKYVIKGKTIGNALMFIPDDGVFAFVHKEYGNLIEYAGSKNVVLVSPKMLPPLLGAFHVIQIDAKKSKNIAKINEALNNLGKDFKKFTPRWEKLNTAIQSLTNKSNEFGITVSKIDRKFDSVQKIEFPSEEPEEEIATSSLTLDALEDEGD